MKKIRILCIVLILISGIDVPAQVLTETSEYPANKADEVELPDTSFYLNIRQFPKDSILAWKNNPAYDYMKVIEERLRERNKRINETLSKAGRSVSWLGRILSSPIFKLLAWLVGISVILLIIYQFIGRGGIVMRKKAKPGIDAHEELQIELMDFERQYQLALAQKNYRSAIKYLFLRTIHVLEDKELIVYAPDKTNRQYLAEIPAGLRKEFASLSLLFEYVWYGNQLPENHEFLAMEQKFRTFIDKIQGS